MNIHWLENTSSKEEGGFEMTKRVEIYFKDLVPEAQAHLLNVFETTEEEENCEIEPLAVIERELYQRTNPGEVWG